MTITSKERELDQSLEDQDWPNAKKLLMAFVKEDPDDHWFWAHLAFVNLELWSMKRAKSCIHKARELNSSCPVVCWFHACILDADEDDLGAINEWKRIVKKPDESLAYGKCGEGVRFAKSLKNDSRYRIALCYRRLASRSNNLAYWRLALRWMEVHLNHRASATTSLYKSHLVYSFIRRINEEVPSI